MGKITTINSQTNYRNNLKVVPFEKTIIDNYFSKIDQVWEYAPDIEEYSIDESFLFFFDFNWSIKDYEEIGFDLKHRMERIFISRTRF